MNYRICFAAYLRMLGRRESTIKSYGRALVEYAAYCGRQKKSSGLLKQFNPHKLQSYKDSLLYDRGLRPSTVNRRLSALSAFARFLLSKGLLKGNPLELVPRAGREEINKEHMQKVWDGSNTCAPKSTRMLLMYGIALWWSCFMLACRYANCAASNMMLAGI